MFIEGVKQSYAADGSQYAGPGRFLVLIQDRSNYKSPIKAFVTDVLLTQLGQWMMGKVVINIAGNKTAEIVLSGSYGSDGLTKSVDNRIYRQIGIELPEHLCKMWAKGGGHNTAGKESLHMRKWANDNVAQLYVANLVDVKQELRDFLAQGEEEMREG